MGMAKAEGARKPGSAPRKPRSGVLVIVESPAKAKTIEKYLGPGYTVLASMGHLIDLPRSRIGIDVEGGFEPEYLTVRGKAGLLKELRRAARKSSLVLLASDNDREGEAIAFHLRDAIVAGAGSRDAAPPIERIAFDEITPQAIREAVEKPRGIDESRVAAQKARRVLDRLVGYNLSPLLWKKVKNGLSAGRVQSVALKLICDREREVESYIPEEFWRIEADLKKGRGSFAAELVSLEGEGTDLRDRASAEAAAGRLAKELERAGGEASVLEVREAEEIRAPKPPFTTSKLQQVAANRLGFTSKKTMQVAQQLYEGVNVGDERIGLITYMRTDSTRAAPQAIQEARAYLAERHPAELPGSPNVYAAGVRAQDAHEAIRPTVVAYEPGKVAGQLSKDQYKLYSLIWERFVGSQMTPAKFRSAAADIAIGDAVFRASSSRLVERGFYELVKLEAGKEGRAGARVPELRPGDALKVLRLRPEQRFARGPSRFTDATIVEALDELGIGRPSTYAPIISVLLERYYVTRENRQLVPTTLGRMIGDILSESFPEVLDASFTAGMEGLLDRVEEGGEDWVSMIGDFYGPFKKRVDEVMGSLASYRGSLDEPTELRCEKCGRPMVKKLGRFGFFLACAGFPECRNTRSIPLAKCPRCGGDIVARKKSNGRGREFYGCTNYPECGFVTYSKPTGSTCPKCGWFLVEKYEKKTGPRKACINPECDYLHARGDGADGASPEGNDGQAR